MKVGTKLKKEKISKMINTDLVIMDNIIKKQLERGREKSKNGPTYIDNRNMTKDTKEGMEFFDNGGRLSNEELANRPYYFKIGYNIAYRRDIAVRYEISKGIEFFNNGGVLELLSEEEIKGFSTYFIQGYESAKKEAHTLKKFESRK